MNSITKIKIKRFFRRSSNKLVEQIIVAVQKLEKSLIELDKEQDELNKLAKIEIDKATEKARIKQEMLEAQLEHEREAEVVAKAKIEQEFSQIQQINQAERESALKIKTNLEKITSGS